MAGEVRNGLKGVRLPVCAAEDHRARVKRGLVSIEASEQIHAVNLRNCSLCAVRKVDNPDNARGLSALVELLSKAGAGVGGLAGVAGHVASWGLNGCFWLHSNSKHAGLKVK